MTSAAFSSHGQTAASEHGAPRVAVVVLAAGNGARLGRGEPKAFVHLAGKPILAHALESVFDMREQVQVIVTVPSSYIPITRELIHHVRGARPEACTIVVGGASRQDSVRVALEHLLPSVEVVLVHDAARPLTPNVVFDSVVAEVMETGAGVVPGIAVADTIKRIDDNNAVLETVDRSQLTAVQTPQGFPRSALVEAHANAGEEHTDDAALVSSQGLEVRVIAGDQLASKITTAWELRRTEDMLQNVASSTVRVGTGTDVHAFDEGKELWLAGLHWPGEVGLKGHSDGDVVSHAICDAMLAAARLGDVGEVFGTDDPRFAEAHGEVFLRESVRRIDEIGYELSNVSVQIIGNRPKLGPRRREAEAHLSAILGATVSISATTSDALGFTGRGEGIAAIATALVHSKTAEHRYR
ncbi:2-C-methyl-D-erythritol 4-phosphate cytidylyltransferase [Humidisolicoccus flavus]|uniref:2-C-methyl-D-erythritol 4-phosphate cytidylyltransferase n=1 Tax=Humidisolicoccus flavus TaxID=3111414 RepID=UPI0032444A9F